MKRNEVELGKTYSISTAHHRERYIWNDRRFFGTVQGMGEYPWKSQRSWERGTRKGASVLVTEIEGDAPTTMSGREPFPEPVAVGAVIVVPFSQIRETEEDRRDELATIDREKAEKDAEAQAKKDALRQKVERIKAAGLSILLNPEVLEEDWEPRSHGSAWRTTHYWDEDEMNLYDALMKLVEEREANQ